MVKRAIWSVLAAFMAWSIPDFVLHGLLACSTYEASAKLWRPMDQMNMPITPLLS